MMKNNKPYTNENGHIDDALVTDLDTKSQASITEWIKSNIRPSQKVLQGRTSYGLKHVLERDTGIYLTNNQFKDAMLSAGYSPVNPNELNWRYRIVLTREINDNPSPFFKWAKQFQNEQSPRGDFAKDMLADFDFPKAADYKVIKRYLERISACVGAMDAFEELWRDYERKGSRTATAK